MVTLNLPKACKMEISAAEADAISVGVDGGFFL